MAPKYEPVDKVIQKASERMDHLAIEHANDVICRLMDTEMPYISMESYCFLRWNEIWSYARWAGTGEKYRRLWDEILVEDFGHINLLDCIEKAVLERSMTLLVKRVGDESDAVKDIVRRAWIFLDWVVRLAIDEQILSVEKSPIHFLANKSKIKIATKARKRLASSSLAEDMAIAFLKECNSRESDVFAALQVQLLTGIDVMGSSVRFEYQGRVGWKCA